MLMSLNFLRNLASILFNIIDFYEFNGRSVDSIVVSKEMNNNQTLIDRFRGQRENQRRFWKFHKQGHEDHKSQS